jgi:hypothetical protein
MSLRRLPFDAARWALVQARSIALKSPRLSDWLAARIRRFPWLYLKLVGIFSEETARQGEVPLITPDLTPATKDVLAALRAEIARSTGKGG